MTMATAGTEDPDETDQSIDGQQKCGSSSSPTSQPFQHQRGRAVRGEDVDSEGFTKTCGGPEMDGTALVRGPQLDSISGRGS